MISGFVGKFIELGKEGGGGGEFALQWISDKKDFGLSLVSKTVWCSASFLNNGYSKFKFVLLVHNVFMTDPQLFKAV